MTVTTEIELRKQLLTFTVPAIVHAPVTAPDRQHHGLWWVECSGCTWLGPSSWSQYHAIAKFREHREETLIEAVRLTGAGKMDARKALTTCEWDPEAAMALIRDWKRTY